MAIDAQTLEELKNQLLQEKTEVEENLKKIANPKENGDVDYETRFNELGSDSDENATEVSEYVDNLAVEKTLEKRLQEIKDALQRMEDGTYGFCSNCGEGKQEINIERLKANPAANTCIKCG